MKLILTYMRPYRAPALRGVFIKIIATLMLLLIPYVLEHLMDAVVPQKRLLPVLLWGLVMVALAFFERLMNLASNRLSIRVARDGAFDLRRDLFAKSMSLSGAQADAFGLPSLTARLTNDVYTIQGFMQNLQTFAIRAPILVLGSVALTLTMDAPLAAVLCVAAPLMVGAVALVSWKGIPLYDRVRTRVDAATRILRENLTGVRVIKALSREEHEAERFEAASAALEKDDAAAGAVMSLPGPAATLLLNLGLVLIVLLGARRVDAGLTKPGVILAFLTWFNFILMGVMGLNRIFLMLSRARASANRAAAVLAQPEALPVAEHPGREDAALIEFDRVTFRYGDAGAPSLSDLSFTVKRGGTLGIIGPTGCGKTTIVNLLLRFYDPTEGRVLVGGRDVRSYDKDELRRRFGAVLQNDLVFADTLEENVTLGREISAERVAQAAEDAQADFVAAYPEGLAHRAAARGADLSGGQRQRLLIARALAGDPEVLIFDDATSALDYRTDAALRKAVRARHGAAAQIVVAQRVSAIMGMDEILVLDEGKLVGRGTHAQLLETCPQYREIYETQMGEAV